MNGYNNSKNYLEKYSTSLFPRKFTCSIYLEMELIQLEITELCLSEITDLEEVESSAYPQGGQEIGLSGSLTLN